jgi:hypothetical protein
MSSGVTRTCGRAGVPAQCSRCYHTLDALVVVEEAVRLVRVLAFAVHRAAALGGGRPTVGARRAVGVGLALAAPAERMANGRPRRSRRGQAAHTLRVGRAPRPIGRQSSLLLHSMHIAAGSQKLVAPAVAIRRARVLHWCSRRRREGIATGQSARSLLALVLDAPRLGRQAAARHSTTRAPPRTRPPPRRSRHSGLRSRRCKWIEPAAVSLVRTARPSPRSRRGPRRSIENVTRKRSMFVMLADLTLVGHPNRPFAEIPEVDGILHPTTLL